MRHRLAFFASFLLLALSSVPAHGAAGPWEENPESAVRLISAWAEAPRPGQEQPETGGEIVLGLHFTTQPGWHVYWKNSGSAGFPPMVDFSATPEVREAELLWPAPERYELPGDLVSFGYEGEVVYPVRVSWGEVGEAAESVTFTVDVDYLVCEVDCIPYRYLLTLEQPLAAPGAEGVPAPAEADLLTFWRERVPEPVGEVEGIDTEARLVRVPAGEPGGAAGSDGIRLEIRVTAEAELPEAPGLFFEAHEGFEIGTPEAERTEGDGTTSGWIYRVPLSFLTTPDVLPEEESFAWTLTELPAEAGLPHAVEAEGSAPLVEETPWGGTEGEAGGGADLASVLPAAFLAGLAGALTPTVLPLFLALILAARSRAPLLAAAGGVVAAALAAAVGASLAGGTWGAQLQSARWGMIASGVSVVLALNLLGLLPWPLPAARPSRGTAALSGALAVGLALAWNLPGGGRAFGAALREAGSGQMGAALPAAALVAGVALTLPLLGAALLLPVLTRRFEGASSEAEGSEDASEPGLPETAGNRFARTVLAFVILGGTVWLLHGVSALVEPPVLAFFQAGLLSMGLLAWLRARLGRGRRAAQILDLAVLVVLAVLVHWLA